MKSKNIILLFVFLLGALHSFSQKVTDKEEEEVHSPKKATLYSAVLPGLGQYYNKKYWKIPVVYAAMGGATYLAIQNQSQFNRYKSAYLIRQDEGIDEFTQSDGTEIYNDQALLDFMDRYRRNRDYCFIGMALFYIVQIVDANVDANLYNFDIGDDLSLRIIHQPINTVVTRTPVLGVGLRLDF